MLHECNVNFLGSETCCRHFVLLSSTMRWLLLLALLALTCLVYAVEEAHYKDGQHNDAYVHSSEDADATVKTTNVHHAVIEVNFV